MLKHNTLISEKKKIGQKLCVQTMLLSFEIKLKQQTIRA